MSISLAALELLSGLAKVRGEALCTLAPSQRVIIVLFRWKSCHQLSVSELVSKCSVWTQEKQYSFCTSYCPNCECLWLKWCVPCKWLLPWKEGQGGPFRYMSQCIKQLNCPFGNCGTCFSPWSHFGNSFLSLENNSVFLIGRCHLQELYLHTVLLKTTSVPELFCGGIFILSLLCAGESGSGSLWSEESHQFSVQLYRVPVQPPSPAPLPWPSLHDSCGFPVPLCLAHWAPGHAGWEGTNLWCAYLQHSRL